MSSSSSSLFVYLNRTSRLALISAISTTKIHTSITFRPIAESARNSIWQSQRNGRVMIICSHMPKIFALFSLPHVSVCAVISESQAYKPLAAALASLSANPTGRAKRAVICVGQLLHPFDTRIWDKFCFLLILLWYSAAPESKSRLLASSPCVWW